ncbi:MAG: chorismate synthase [Acidobacteria bacterium]|nr:MAG: chorismate synthase [Acidobacteriota bacterium]
MLRFLTAGESHGRALVVILEGMPSGLEIDADAIDRHMRRRQVGHGRGRRMSIESDRVQILSGVRHGATIGSPIAILVPNRDWPNWEHTMAVEAQPPASAGGARRSKVTRPRPGHADLAGGLKHGFDDLRDVLERASARETAARVAAGSVARVLLARLGVTLASHVTAIGGARLSPGEPVPFDRIAAIPDDSPTRCVDDRVGQAMIAAIDLAKEAGETLGGVFEVVAHGVPPGLGSYVQWDRRLDGRLAQALMSVPAVKAVSIGDGVEGSGRRGSEVHDPIVPASAADAGRPWGLARPTNHAGGLEGGVSNGEEIRVAGYMKPIATLMRPLASVDLSDGSVAAAAIERSDTCAVPAAAVIGEAVVAIVLADAFTEKFGGDSVTEMTASLEAWREGLLRRARARRPAVPDEGSGPL